MSVVAPQIEYLDDLLAYIKAGKVIPIIGPELVTVLHQGTQVPIDRYYALRLIERLNIDPEALMGGRHPTAGGSPPIEFTLSDVVAYHVLSQRGKMSQMPLRLLNILNEFPLPTPEPLQKLARIRGLRLFVTTTVDRLLAQAIGEVRSGIASHVEELAYTKKQFSDLEPGWEKGNTPTVFYLFGRISESRDYVITEEDTLEWLHTLQSDTRRPERLFDQLRDKHLLFLGCRFPDWLARFVIRTAKRQQLSVEREVMEVVADACSSRDNTLTMFLDHFSYNTKVFPGDASEFVDMLSARWQEKYPDNVGHNSREFDEEPHDVEMRPGSVFVSYASEDRKAAERLCAGLSEFVDVWLDREQLKAGTDWDIKIRQNIRQCALFIPLVSRNATNRDEGYFRTEWAEARRRAAGIDQTVRPFLVPVAIDDVPPHAAGIPEEFWAQQVERLPDGDVSDSFRQEIIKLVRRTRRGG